MNVNVIRDEFNETVDRNTRDDDHKQCLLEELQRATLRFNRERIEFVHARFVESQNEAPVVVVSDLIYDDVGEQIAVQEMGQEWVRKAQQSYAGNGVIPVLISSYPPPAAVALLKSWLTDEQARDALRPPADGNGLILVFAFGLVGGYEMTRIPK